MEYILEIYEDESLFAKKFLFVNGTKSEIFQKAKKIVDTERLSVDIFDEKGFYISSVIPSHLGGHRIENFFFKVR